LQYLALVEQSHSLRANAVLHGGKQLWRQTGKRNLALRGVQGRILQRQHVDNAHVCKNGWLVQCGGARRSAALQQNGHQIAGEGFVVARHGVNIGRARN